MTDHEDQYGIGKEVDTDYIDVESQRADISVSGDKAESDKFERGSRAEQNADMYDGVDMSHRFDFRDGNGAASDVDELIDQNAIIENDGRGKTRTFFYVDEAAEAQQGKFSRLRRWQSEELDDEREVENRSNDISRWIDMFCSTLGMGDYQQSRVETVVEEVGVEFGPYKSEETILAAISLVANEDDWMIRDDDTFRGLMTDVGAAETDIRSLRKRIRKRSDLL